MQLEERGKSGDKRVVECLQGEACGTTRSRQMTGLVCVCDIVSQVILTCTQNGALDGTGHVGELKSSVSTENSNGSTRCYLHTRFWLTTTSSGSGSPEALGHCQRLLGHPTGQHYQHSGRIASSIRTTLVLFVTLDLLAAVSTPAMPPPLPPPRLCCVAMLAILAILAAVTMAEVGDRWKRTETFD